MDTKGIRLFFTASCCIFHFLISLLILDYKNMADFRKCIILYKLPT